MSTLTYLRPKNTRQSGVLTGSFRRSGRLVEDEAGNRAVAQAVVRAKQGDREALRYLYVHYADHVYGYVASIVRDEHEAEDVTQQLFAKLMTALPKYEPREVPFSAWIIRVARNVARRPHAPAARDPVRRGPRARYAHGGRRLVARCARSACATRSRRCLRSSARSSSCATSSG